MVASDRLVGRDVPLSVVDDLLGRAADGEPGLVVVAGDAGVGKTRFVREVGVRAEGDGWTVLTGGCVELSEGAAALAPVAGVLRQLARDRGDAALAGLLEGPARLLARLVPELGVDTGGLEGASAVQVLVAFHRLVRDLADERPVLLVLEDLHWADTTTRDLLRHLASRLYDERLLVLASVRTDDLDRTHPLRPVLAEVVRRPEVERLDLGPLDPEALMAHLAALAREGDDRDLAGIVARAGGNPFFAEELLAVGVDAGLPPSLEEVLSVRLERLPADSQHLLGEAAVLGSTVDPILLAAITSLDEAAARAAVRAALDDGVLLVDGAWYAFRHALLREVALDRLLPDERVDAHAAAAAALEADPDRAVTGRAGVHGQAAHHWWEARDLPRCLAASVAAAEATRSFAGAVALQHLRRAVELWTRVDDAERLTGTTYPALLMTAARVAWELDDPIVRDLAAAAVRAAERSGDPAARAEAILLHSQVLARFGRGEEAVAVAAAELARHGDQRTAARAVALCAHGAAASRVGVGAHGTWDLDAIASELAEALAIATERNDRIAAWSACTTIVENVGPYIPDRTHRAVSAVRQLGGTGWDGETARDLAMRLEARHAYFCGEFTDLETVLDRWESISPMTADTQAETWVGRWSMSLYVDTWAGRLDRATNRLGDVDLRDYAGSPHNSLWMVWATGDLLRWTGRARRALDRAELGTTTAEDAGYHRVLWAAEVAACRAAVGWPPGEILAAASTTVNASLDRWWPWPIARLVEAVATAVEGRPLDDGGLRVVDGWLERLDRHVRWLRHDAPVRPWAVACLQRARAERAALASSPDPSLWDPVVADFEHRGGIPYAAIARLRRAASLAMADGGTSPACEADLLAARETFTDLGMTALRDDADALARRLRVRLPSHGGDNVAADGQVLPSLTDREREVLALVARGWSNKRVGAHLFISPKTVSVHMSNTMRKLDVDSRTQAVVVANRAGLVTDD